MSQAQRLHDTSNPRDKDSEPSWRDMAGQRGGCGHSGATRAAPLLHRAPGRHRIRTRATGQNSAGDAGHICGRYAITTVPEARQRSVPVGLWDRRHSRDHERPLSVTSITGSRLRRPSSSSGGAAAPRGRRCGPGPSPSCIQRRSHGACRPCGRHARSRPDWPVWQPRCCPLCL